MSRSAKNSLVPQLRFPEFESAEPWKEKPLSSITTAIYDGTHQTPKYVESGVPFFSVENIVSGKSNKFISEEDYKVATAKNRPSLGDILITRIGNIGFSAVVEWDYDFSIYVTLAVVKRDKRFNSQYLHSYMQSERYQREIQSKSLLNAVPCKINMDELRKTQILLPCEEEQKKVADCLSSIDKLIAAQAEKIETLKAHKKGLMQKLFLAEGKTTPELRFREFRENGEWETIRFYDLIVQVLDFRGRTPKKLGMDWGGDIVSLSANNVKNGFIDLEAECNQGNEELYKKWMGGVNLEKGDIVFTMEAPLGNAVIIPDNQKYILSQRVVAFKTKEFVNNEFLLQLIRSKRFQSELARLSTGSTAKGINQKTLGNLSIRFPKKKEEQAKIAELLATIDEIILAYKSKLISLKAHKKGLMQSMFPKIKGVL